MAARTITAANAVFTLGVAGLFPVAQQLQGFAADAAFDTDPIELAETQMGVDGHLSVGYVPNPVPQTISLQSDSPSVDFFETWYNANLIGKTALIAFGVVRIPSLGKSYTLSNGVLMRWPPIPGVARVLKPRVASLTWGSILAANI